MPSLFASLKPPLSLIIGEWGLLFIGLVGLIRLLSYLLKKPQNSERDDSDANASDPI